MERELRNQYNSGLSYTYLVLDLDNVHLSIYMVKFSVQAPGIFSYTFKLSCHSFEKDL